MMHQPPPVDTFGSDDDSPDPAGSALDERRLTMRAYLYWQTLLNGRLFPSVADLDPQAVESFSDQSILLDFTQGPETPVLRFVGKSLREEGGLEQGNLSPIDIPTRSLISRLTAHYMEIHANLSPVGFEAEFESPRGVMTKYRGILLPLSDDGHTINFMYGVVSWKDETLQAGTAELAIRPAQVDEADDALELTTALDADVLDLATPLEASPLADDDIEALLLNMPADDSGDPDRAADVLTLDTPSEDGADAPLDLEEFLAAAAPEAPEAVQVDEGKESDAFESLQDLASARHDEEPLVLDMALAAGAEQPPADASDDVLEGPEPLPVEDEALDLGAWAQVEAGNDTEQIENGVRELVGKLELAQLKAAASRSSDHRSRTALYQALAEAHDFALAAATAPGAYQLLLESSGLKQQFRAPFTPIAKLVFGEDYDKTRLTEFAASLSYAHREQVESGRFLDFIENFPGGLKGMVQAERTARAAAMGNRRTDTIEGLRDVLRRVPAIATIDGATIPDQDEFALVLVRRRPLENTVDVIGSVPGASRMAESAAKRLAALHLKKTADSRD